MGPRTRQESLKMSFNAFTNPRSWSQTPPCDGEHLTRGGGEGREMRDRSEERGEIDQRGGRRQERWEERGERIDDRGEKIDERKEIGECPALPGPPAPCGCGCRCRAPPAARQIRNRCASPRRSSAAGSGVAGPGSRVIENKHSTEIGACLTSRVNADTNARRIGRRFSVGRVHVLNNSPARHWSNAFTLALL